MKFLVERILAGCGKTHNHRHSRESGSPEILNKAGFLLPQEWRRKAEKDFFRNCWKILLENTAIKSHPHLPFPKGDNSQGDGRKFLWLAECQGWEINSMNLSYGGWILSPVNIPVKNNIWEKTSCSHWLISFFLLNLNHLYPCQKPRT